MKGYLRHSTSVLAMSLAAGLMSAAQAQTAPAPTSGDNLTAGSGKAGARPGAGLEEVVVTASSKNKKKLRASISVTDVKTAQIEALDPQSQAEVLRLIPGLIVGDTAGAGGNANISVRGLPITTGGSPFVQLQEDGLPTVLFGDMNFGNNDYWERFDLSETVEAVRGGSASALASQAPGAVINYISETGRTPGGAITLTQGLNYDTTKVDFAYGGPIDPTLRFHVDGFGIYGNGGLRDVGYDVQHGYQLKGNITKDLPDDRGYVRLSMKFLDDQEPTNSAYPIIASLGNNAVTGIHAFPGFDSRNQTNMGTNNRTFDIVDDQGHLQQVDANGIHPQSASVGTAIHYRLLDDLTLDDNFRFTSQSGTFATNFFNLTPTSTIIGSSPNGYPNGTNLTVGSVRYADGPNAGRAYNGAYVNTDVNIYTHMRDMGNVVNDFALDYKFDAPIGKVDIKSGVFYMNQTIAQDWHANSNYSANNGKNPAELNLFTGPNGTGQQLSVMGQTGYNTNWGSSVARTYDLSVGDTAPYVDLDYTWNGLDLDADLRYDIVNVSGWAEDADPNDPNSTFLTNVGGIEIPTQIPVASTRENLDYTVSYLSWSFGALYVINNDLSVFARGSLGGKVNTDRNILSGYTNTNGSLNASGVSNALDQIYQEEVGVKSRGAIGPGFFAANLTGFHDSFGVSNFDLTVNNGTYFKSAYEAFGVEFESSYTMDNFAINANVTYTHSRILLNQQGTNPAALVDLGSGFEPPNTPSWVYLIAPTYTYGSVKGGVVIQGQSSANASTSGVFNVPGQTFLDLFLSYAIRPGLIVGFHANNLMNDFGVNAHADQASVAAIRALGAYGGFGGALTAPAENGRTLSLSLTAKF